MAKYRFYIASTFSGDVTGTNNEELAKNIALSEDDFVIDTLTGKWLQSDGEAVDVVASIMSIHPEDGEDNG